MPITMAKTPDGADTPVAFNLHKEQAPFVRDYFDAAKRSGETIDTFICRLACEQAIDHVMSVQLGDREQTRQTERLTDADDLATERAALLGG